MIRDAQHSDIPALLDMGERFTTKAGFAEHVGYCRDTSASLLGSLIDGDDGVLLIGRDCMAGGAVFNHPFNAAHRVGQELFWYSEGREGLKLLDALQQAFVERGANSIVMATMEALAPDSLQRFYMKRGFKPLDRNFIKVL